MDAWNFLLNYPLSAPFMKAKVWTLYLIQNAEGIIYTGIALDPEKRLKAHNSGRGAKFTRNKGPWVLRYVEVCGSVGDALKRERQVKKFRKSQKLALIASLDSQSPEFRK